MASVDPTACITTILTTCGSNGLYSGCIMSLGLAIFLQCDSYDVNAAHMTTNSAVYEISFSSVPPGSSGVTVNNPTYVSPGTYSGSFTPDVPGVYQVDVNLVADPTHGGVPPLPVPTIHSPFQVCVPETCATLGYSCGPRWDGCGSIIECLSCPGQSVCQDVCGTTCNPVGKSQNHNYRCIKNCPAAHCTSGGSNVPCNPNGNSGLFQCTCDNGYLPFCPNFGPGAVLDESPSSADTTNTVFDGTGAVGYVGALVVAAVVIAVVAVAVVVAIAVRKHRRSLPALPKAYSVDEESKEVTAT